MLWYFLNVSIRSRCLELSGSDGVVAKTSANGPVGTGFTSRYLLQPRANL